MMTLVRIGNKTLDPREAVFCIAEAGVNHNGDLRMAKELIDVAAAAGADAVKFQTFIAEEVVTASVPMAGYQRTNTQKTESQLEMLKRLELTLDDHRALARRANDRKILFLSTPHSGKKSANLLEEVGVPAFKVGSGDLTNLPFLEHLATRGRPVILSTGMGTLAEVTEAVKIMREKGLNDIVVLHCTSEYPCLPEHVNMRAMTTIKEVCHVPIGYSDHTRGVEAAVLATRMGAVCIEKHITLDKTLPGPDHAVSLEPKEFETYVRTIRAERRAPNATKGLDEVTLRVMLGTGEKTPTEDEMETARLVRKSVCSARNLAQGALIAGHDITIKRPGTGIPPKEFPNVVGRKVVRPVPKDKPLTWEDLE